MVRKKDHFSIFSLSFSFFGKELENERKMKIPRFSFFLFLSSLFSYDFLSFFLFRSGKREWREEEFFLFFFSFYFLFLGKQRGINWKKLKEFLSIFLINFLSFFFLKTLLFFSFFFFFGRGKRIEEIAFFAIIHFYKNRGCLSKTNLSSFEQKHLSFSSK